MVKIEEEEDSEAKHPSMESSSSLSSHRKSGLYSPSAPHPSAEAAEPSSSFQNSPDTTSSISSDHTFHGFSPIKEEPLSPSSVPTTISASTPPVPVVASRLVRDLPEVVTRTESDADIGFAGEGGDGGGRIVARKGRQQLGVLRRVRREKLVKRAGLGLRVWEFIVCLVSFSVMASDKNRGWALDSFDRYTEFRYSMSVNVIGFAYSGLQGLTLLLQLMTGKDFIRSQLRCYFDFAMDQVLAYLLLSASSSAFTRVDDWISNWGKDQFPTIATASIGVSFIAFVAFALSSLISGYILCML